MAANSSIQQHEPLRVPSNWGTNEKRLIAQLEELFDDIYRRFGRLRLEDLGDALKTRILSTEGIRLEVGAQRVFRAATESDLLIQLAAESPAVPMAVSLLWYDTTNKLFKRCTALGPPIVWETLQTNEVHTSYIDLAGNKLDIGSTGEINIAAGGKINLTSVDALMVSSGTSIGLFVSNAVATKITTFAQPTIPTSISAGDLWFNTSDGNKCYKATAIGDTTIAAGHWVLCQDFNKTTSFAQNGIPTSTAIGDFWVATADNNKLYRAAAIGATTIATGQWVLYQVAAGYVKTSYITIANDIDVDSGGNVNIKSGANLNIKSGADIEIESGGDINIASGGKINIASGGDIIIASGGSFTATAPTTLNITAGSGASAVGIKNDTYFLYAGNATPTDALFSVTMAGALKALSGLIGGFTIASNKLEATPSGKPVLTLDAANSQIKMGGATFSFDAYSLYLDVGPYAGETDSQFTVTGGQNGGYSTLFYVSGPFAGCSGQFQTGGDASINGDLWVLDNCSAASFTDRTPSYDGDALADLALVKTDKKGDIDHSTLPELARKKITRQTRDAKGKIETVEEDGRDIGMMVSVQTKAIQQLSEIATAQQQQIDELTKSIQQLNDTVAAQQKQITALSKVSKK